ncbi:tol-pal system protein YbgF [Candidatus Nitrospira nitrificans]|uniref:Putative TPR repeat containing exported protein periplasmic protein contains a protein prenylyltransferase domain n=1 Tax=Candidatus Nitrospira nitrificans TaxID=1742973 RepID=A0A0S4L2M6_9BACT|nr:tol-pal system protein YbgF [Candidatus Nitrospira nitrificans]CUS31964.1 putative TPR repeat containing exported protein periplasmic protein contains a protein prenylyltransferase domain [Candidatus Nitrospira nitrificans]
MTFQLRTAHGVLLGIVVGGLLLPGCVAQQSDLKKAEKDLQQQLSQTRARQSQEISTLREFELPQLRGELDKALHQARELQGKQEDFKHRSAQLEQQTKKLEQLAAKLEADSSTRYLWMQKSFETQDVKVSARLDELSKAMETLKKEVIDVVQRTNEGLAKRVDVKMEGHQKELAEHQNKIEQISLKFTQFNQALTGFREALTGLNDRVGEHEQVTKHLTSKIDVDSKATATHAEDVNRSVVSITRALEAVGKKVTARLDEQDGRIDGLAKALEQVSNKPASPQPAHKPAHHSAPGVNEPTVEGGETAKLSAGPETTGGSTTISPPQEAPKFEPVQASADPPDRGRYERVLGLFRDGDLEGARQGFAGFLDEYPNSTLAPNARFWLGESYFGKKEFQRAIDAYDKVEIDYPGSEKVPAAILKKGYAYLALKDKRRASSAFKQVVTLYPKTVEAGKASDKLAQLKEVR